MRRWKKVVLGILVVLAMGIGLGRWQIHRMAGELAAQIPLGAVDISAVADGTYRGEYQIEESAARVEVDVEAGLIREIRILDHRHVWGAAGEEVTGRIVEEQKVEVDGISGATLSTRVIQRAVEEALQAPPL